MKTLVLYTSKQGHTKQCVEYIQTTISDVTVRMLPKSEEKLSDYERVIIGTPVYMGSINKHIKQFIADHENQLLQKEIIFLICAMNEEEYPSMIERNFSEVLRNTAQFIHAGGGYDFQKLNFIERFIVRKIAKVETSENHLQYDAIDKVLKK